MRPRFSFLPVALALVCGMHALAQAPATKPALEPPVRGSGDPFRPKLLEGPAVFGPLQNNRAEVFVGPPVRMTGPPVRMTAVSPNEGLCFAMRTYRFERESPGSDTVRPAGSSTCQPASSLRAKSATGTVAPSR